MAPPLVLDVIAKQNSHALSEMANEFDKLANKTDAAGRKFHETGTFSQFLGREIENTKIKVRELGDEFDRTGSKDVFANLKGAQANLKSLEGIRKQLKSALEDGAREAEPNILSSLKGAFSSIEIPGFMPVLVGSIVASAPMLAAALDGVLLSAVGAGGLALGIVGQLKSPTVRGAFSDMGRDLETTLQKATTAFEQPLVAAAHVFGGDLQQAIKSIDFGALSKLVEPLASGLGGLITQMMPGFNEALKAAQPILQEFAKELPVLGSAISDMFHELANSKGAEEGLRTLMMILIGAVEVTGHLIGALSNMYDWLIKVAHGAAMIGQEIAHAFGDKAFSAFFDELEGALRILEHGTGSAGVFGRSLAAAGSAADTAAGRVGFLSDQIGTMATASADAAAAAQALFDTFMSVDQGTLHWNESLTSLHDTLAKNKATLDEHTKAGQQNVAAILSAVTANMQLYQAQVAAGVSADDAAKAYDANEKAIEANLRALGYTPAAIDSVVGKYRGIPDSVSPAQRAFQDMADSVQHLADVLARIFNLPNSKEIRINVSAAIGGASSLGSLANQLAGLVGHRALGGPVIAGQPYVVGDGGRPELFVPSSNGYVLPDASSGYATPYGAQGGGTATTSRVTTVNVTGAGTAFEQAMATWIQYAIRTGLIQLN